MSIRNTILILFLAVATIGISQEDADIPATDDQYEQEYQERIRKEYLFYPPVYIPKDLTDAFIQLNKLIDAASRQKFKAMPEASVQSKLYFSFGRWITQNWGFYGGSRLSHFLKNLGVHHPEDMAAFIMITYHRNLNKKPLDVKELITSFQSKRDKEWNDQRIRGTVIHEETRQRSRDSTATQQGQ